jgi:hypothetical protein
MQVSGFFNSKNAFLHMLTSLDTTDGNEAIALWVNDFPSHY